MELSRNDNTRSQMWAEPEELHGQQNDDYEKQYLSQCLKETRRSSITPRSEGLITPLPMPKQSAGSSLMIYFMLRRFIKRISSRKQNLLNLTTRHLQVIDDSGSDVAQVLNYINSIKTEGISIEKFTQLYKITIQHSSLRNFKEKVYKTIESVKKNLLYVMTLVPLIHPESKHKMRWDYFVSLLRIIMLIIVPLDIGFQTKFMNRSFLTFLIMFIIVVDFIIRINTICFIKGQAIRERSQILFYQIKQTFLIDAITIITMITFLSYNVPETLVIVFLQYKYINDLSQKSDQTSVLSKSQKGIFNLLKLITSLVYIIHIFSCVWFWISEIDVPNSWIQQKHLVGSDWTSQYLESFYFGLVTITTIGYGDNVPQSSQEKLLIILYIMGGSLWFSYSINFIGGIIDDITENQRERNRRMRVINKYFQKRAIPYSLQYQIKEYLTYRWKEEDEIDLQLEQNLIESLSDELKESLEKQAHQLFASNSDFLNNNFSEEFRKSLIKSIKRKIIEPQNFFSIQFDNCHHLCYLEQGEIAYQDKDPQRRARLNAILKQGQFLSVQDFITDQNDLNSFKALGYVSLLVLSKKDFLKKIKDFQNDYQVYCNLRDQINLNGVNLKDGVYCPVCQGFEHNYNKCQQVQYVPDREAIIKNYLYPKSQDRRKFNRRRLDRTECMSSIQEKDMVEEFALVFQNDNPQIVDAHIKLQMAAESDRLGEDFQPSPATLEYIPEIIPSPKTNNNKSNVSILPMPSVRINSIEIEEEKSQPSNPSQVKFKRKNSHVLTFYRRGSAHHKTIKANEASSPDISQEFISVLQENISHVFDKLKKELQNEEFKYAYQFQQLEILYLKHKSKDLEGFDLVKAFDKYKPEFNINHIIKIHNIVDNDWEHSIIKRYMNYMFFPFNYIKQNLMHFRARILKAQKQNPKFQRVKNKIRILQLRNSFQQKQINITSSRNIKVTQVTPKQSDSPFLKTLKKQ
ncbi:hypothetical protein pb186bvf_005881 [Paramecium bursaria]